MLSSIDLLPNVKDSKKPRLELILLLVFYLHMQRFNGILSIIFNNRRTDQQWNILTRGSDSIHTETPRQTSNTTKQTFKRFGKMMGYKVFINLNHSNP